MRPSSRAGPQPRLSHTCMMMTFELDSSGTMVKVDAEPLRGAPGTSTSTPYFASPEMVRVLAATAPLGSVTVHLAKLSGNFLAVSTVLPAASYSTLVSLNTPFLFSSLRVRHHCRQVCSGDAAGTLPSRPMPCAPVDQGPVRGLEQGLVLVPLHVIGAHEEVGRLLADVPSRRHKLDGPLAGRVSGGRR